MQCLAVLGPMIIVAALLFACDNATTSQPDADGDIPVFDGDIDGSLPDGDSAAENFLPDGDSQPEPDGDKPLDGDVDSDGDNTEQDNPLDGDVDPELERIPLDGDMETETPPLPDPGLPGDSGWTQTDHDLVISGGPFGTTIPLTIHIPEGAGPFPVIVFTHGFQLGPPNYTRYAEHLASWGFMVAMPQMPGSILNPETHTELKGHLIAILDWITEDNANVSGVLSGKADLDKLGLSGHSMGGKISLLVTTEDARPKASFTRSGRCSRRTHTR